MTTDPWDKSHARVGQPEPGELPVEIEFTKKRDGRAYNRVMEGVGAGWYSNRFVHGRAADGSPERLPGIGNASEARLRTAGPRLSATLTHVGR